MPSPFPLRGCPLPPPAHQVCAGLGALSPTVARQESPMCWGIRSSPCMYALWIVARFLRAARIFFSSLSLLLFSFCFHTILQLARLPACLPSFLLVLVLRHRASHTLCKHCNMEPRPRPLSPPFISRNKDMLTCSSWP